MRASSASCLTALVACFAVVASLAACGAPPDTSTTWVYDEAVTLKNTGTEQQASVRSHLKGFALSLRIDQGPDPPFGNRVWSIRRLRPKIDYRRSFCVEGGNQ